MSRSVRSLEWTAAAISGNNDSSWLGSKSGMYSCRQLGHQQLLVVRFEVWNGQMQATRDHQLLVGVGSKSAMDSCRLVARFEVWNGQLQATRTSTTPRGSVRSLEWTAAGNSGITNSSWLGSKSGMDSCRQLGHQQLLVARFEVWNGQLQATRASPTPRGSVRSLEWTDAGNSGINNSSWLGSKSGMDSCRQLGHHQLLVARFEVWNGQMQATRASTTPRGSRFEVWNGQLQATRASTNSSWLGSKSGMDSCRQLGRHQLLVARFEVWNGQLQATRASTTPRGSVRSREWTAAGNSGITNSSWLGSKSGMDRCRQLGHQQLLVARFEVWNGQLQATRASTTPRDGNPPVSIRGGCRSPAAVAIDPLRLLALLGGYRSPAAGYRSPGAPRSLLGLLALFSSVKKLLATRATWPFSTRKHCLSVNICLLRLGHWNVKLSVIPNRRLLA